MPANYRESWPELWEYATVRDLGKAAKDWPELNFIIYHSALRPFLEVPEGPMAEFEKTGRIDWVTDLAEIPGKWGVDNVYAELGTCFATTSITTPRLAAAMLGQLINGLGSDKVVWGTDSVWYGSPQWQIEALRRLEMPEDLQETYGYPELGAADGSLKNDIFANNAARLYGLDRDDTLADISADEISSMRDEFAALNEGRSNLRYGYVRNA
jgi:predicted TIM-barrel fold metal-dependent hydrolase